VGSAAERQLCPGGAPLKSPAGLRECLQAARGEERGREVNICLVLEDTESSLWGGMFPASQSVAAGHCICRSWGDLLKLAHRTACGLCKYNSQSYSGVGEEDVLQSRDCLLQHPGAVCWGRDSAACQGQHSACPGSSCGAVGRSFGWKA